MPLSHHLPTPCSVRGRGGFTLLEVLMALTITLILMALVMEMFTQVNDGIVNARAGMDLRDQLRNAKQRLITDLQGVTAPTIPPLDPSMQLGYFEYVEGPRVANSQFAANSVGGDRGENLGGNWYTSRGGNNNHAVNSMIGDNDDILMFTTSSTSDKFVGRGGVKSGVNLSVKSRTAEVAWFLRRRTEGEVRSRRSDSRPEYYSLHRRQFLVLPNGGYWGALN
ncbi:MAG: prepilin-type N-terminal cleavage/methylation domain-containing protein, partial [Planctomycetales bacterium]|nr:prepilin-type N-terminal cleavage/methylation domain-containing protein [Planctomycetales bacterium]